MKPIRVHYRQERVCCGKPTCHCGSGSRHGPYWYAYWWANGGRHRRYIGKIRRELDAHELSLSEPRRRGPRPRAMDQPVPKSSPRLIRKQGAHLRAVPALPNAYDLSPSPPPEEPGPVTPLSLEPHESEGSSSARRKNKKLTRADLREMAIAAGYPPDRIEGAVEWASILAETEERTIGGVRVVGRGSEGPRGRVARAADRKCWHRFVPNRFADGPALWVSDFPTRRAAEQE